MQLSHHLDVPSPAVGAEGIEEEAVGRHDVGPAVVSSAPHAVALAQHRQPRDKKLLECARVQLVGAVQLAVGLQHSSHHLC